MKTYTAQYIGSRVIILARAYIEELTPDGVTAKAEETSSEFKRYNLKHTALEIDFNRNGICILARLEEGERGEVRTTLEETLNYKPSK
jgi:hypothetical protein